MKKLPFYWILCIGLILVEGCDTPSKESNNEQNNEQAESDSAEVTSKPNIIMLVGDDQGYPYFGFMGADYVQTPNMDKLAESGIVFTDSYVSDNHCRPSLATLLTGILPIDYYQKVEDFKAQ